VKFSSYAQHYSSESGIVQLMQDLTIAAPPGGQLYPMGGGNPAHIPEVEDALRQIASEVVDDTKRFTQMVGDYDAPQGHERFRAALAERLSGLFNQPLSASNIAITNGSQASFEILFNAFAGAFSDGSWRHIELPITPEYVGYNDMGRQARPILRSTPARIDLIGDQQFKYGIDLDRFELNVRTSGAVCLSRPTNPSGNVVTDAELTHVAQQCAVTEVPLIIDGAYGLPFPGMIYTQATPFWDDNTILCLSLSKLGLPGVRTGIIVAATQVTELIRNANAINGLAPTRVGPELVLPLLSNHRLDELCETVIRPHYLSKQSLALNTLLEAAKGLPIRVHRADGAMFLWVWFENLPGGTQKLYELAAAEGVVTVAGHHFFQGLTRQWQHANECLRVNYAGDPNTVETGITRLITLARRLYDEDSSNV
jgi:valine--pyruvate aminotransferase